MNPLIDDAIYLLIDKGWQEIVPLFILSAMRPLGLMYGFVGFTWAMVQTRIIRTMIAIAVGIPMVLLELPTLIILIEAKSTFILAITSVTEVGIGFALGFIASLPFFALGLAGTLTDQFRGETESGLHTPYNGSITTFGVLYTVVALYAFAFAGGIPLLFRALYESFVIWPLLAPLPELTSNSIRLVLSVFGAATLVGLQLAIPLLLVLIFVEVVVAISARIARRFNFYNLAFPLKNLTMIALLPLLGMYIWIFMTENINLIFLNFSLLNYFSL